LVQGAGVDNLDGGGHGHARHSGSDAGVQIDLANGTGFGWHAENSRLAAILHVSGSSFDDVLIGGTQGNGLEGLFGNDHLLDGAANDVLDGDAGNDIFFFAGVGSGMTGGSLALRAVSTLATSSSCAVRPLPIMLPLGLPMSDEGTDTTRALDGAYSLTLARGAPVRPASGRRPIRLIGENEDREAVAAAAGPFKCAVPRTGG
jgi:Ca2+-binding RTX toxin-like protein